MWDAIEQRVLQINKAAGVEIIIMPDNSLHINIAIAETKKNTIIKNDAISGIEQIQQLPQKIDKNIPLSLVFNGKAVLIKKVNPIAGNGSLSSILPNANPEDFYYEKFQGDRINTYSIARKEIINKIIAEIKNQGFKVISVSLGFSSVENILPFLNAQTEKQIETDSTIIEIGNTNEISDIRSKEVINNSQYQPNEYLVANQYIKPATLLAFSAAAGLLADNIKTESSINKQVLLTEKKRLQVL